MVRTGTRGRFGVYGADMAMLCLSMGSFRSGSRPVAFS
jgi:hypothetical protein